MSISSSRPTPPRGSLLRRRRLSGNSLRSSSMARSLAHPSSRSLSCTDPLRSRVASTRRRPKPWLRSLAGLPDLPSRRRLSSPPGATIGSLISPGTRLFHPHAGDRLPPAGFGSGPLPKRKEGHCCIGRPGFRRRDWRDEIAPIPSSLPGPPFGLRRLPLPAGGHRPGRPVVPMVSVFPTGTSRSFSPSAGSKSTTSASTAGSSGSPRSSPRLPEPVST